MVEYHFYWQLALKASARARLKSSKLISSVCSECEHWTSVCYFSIDSAAGKISLIFRTTPTRGSTYITVHRHEASILDNSGKWILRSSSFALLPRDAKASIRVVWYHADIFAAVVLTLWVKACVCHLDTVTAVFSFFESTHTPTHAHGLATFLKKQHNSLPCTFFCIVAYVI